MMYVEQQFQADIMFIIHATETKMYVQTAVFQRCYFKFQDISNRWIQFPLT